ncbi:hypothetical protein PoB_001027500 [Plakobranchus ocellatus]|uniref:Secreted protein n=1 Tax=Plakobranchus ocellatus TaxID=259542 RepID=A0AAV3YMQ3_9GAST|nr:hypothetical protein PoB_001027500 [Plakobranchus ocellatus]
MVGPIGRLYSLILFLSTAFTVWVRAAPTRHSQKFIVMVHFHKGCLRDYFLTDRYLPVALYHDDQGCVRRTAPLDESQILRLHRTMCASC